MGNGESSYDDSHYEDDHHHTVHYQPDSFVGSSRESNPEDFRHSFHHEPASYARSLMADSSRPKSTRIGDNYNSLDEVCLPIPTLNYFSIL